MENPLLPLRAVITDVRQESSDIRTYSLALGDGKFDALPGQFNMVGTPGAGEVPISLSSLVKGKTFEHTIRSAGRVTHFLERLGKDNILFLRGPYGNSWPIEEAEGNDLMVIAGGLGLAPVRPVLQTVVENPGRFRKVTLIFGARNPSGVIFREEFDVWRGHMDILLTVDEVPRGIEWKHDTGFVVGLLDKVSIDPANTVAFMCGPELMMRFVSKGLIFRGVPSSRVYVTLERRMKCGVAQCGHCQFGSEFVCKDGPVFAYRDISDYPDGLL